MALPSRLAIPAFLGLILASTGCSGCDDDPAPAPAPSKGGSAGAAGKAGAGGSAGGAAGKGGNTTGGSAGSTAGGSSGTGGVGGGTAGTGGSAGSSGATACGAATGNGTLASAAAVPIGDARVPFDSIPSPDGCSVYFTALDAQGVPSVFKSAVGGTPSRLGGGGQLVLPSSIATNSTGGTIYIADPEAEPTPNVFGAIYTVSSTGGTPEALPGTTGKAPVGVTVARLTATDVLYFTGREPNGNGAVYSIPAAGGAATTIYSGADLPAPTAVAVADDGAVYVSDSILGAVYQLKGNQLTFLRGNFKNGFPAGIAVSRDGKGLLVGTRAAASRIDRIDLAAATTTSFTTGLEGGNDPAGLHRAITAEVYSFVDQGVGTAGGVYLLKP